MASSSRESCSEVALPASCFSKAVVFGSVVLFGGRFQRGALQALDHQDFPFPRIVEQLHVTRDPSRPPLVQVSFTLERAQRQEEAGRARFLFPNAKAHLNVGGLLGETFYIEQQTCHHELELVLEHSSGTIHGLLCYCADLFAPRMMQRMVEHYKMLLHSAVASPDAQLSEIAWYTDQERAQVVSKWNQTEVEFDPELTLHQMFQQQVGRTREAVAITGSGRDYSYQQLDSWANRLAHKLVARGVGPGRLVAICLDRSPEKVALILATLKAGGACVPLDPNSPPDRLQTILADADPVDCPLIDSNQDGMVDVSDLWLFANDWLKGR